ncbi:zinc-dependent alcohol dehydrogenase [Rhodococcus sp. T7]|uniref:zinc-dependent alcohol dehydrogenase n=1 Tax=Rhodococcus sp. T7 TaxID=627444 RepID=UPI001358864C|nr:zinc-binding dehydrogenase [Rhodococcus sp. T7]KAF0957986.1 D-arabitol-phosphate dehydrogenase [Rhodococcus sp. T7]KAF0960145.1 D-arabitol-phosphate dehydrogenase [Rhodococcus sp. T7]
MASTARAIVYEGPQTFALRDFPLPELSPGDLLVEVLLCGIDGSELHMYRGEMEWLNQLAPVIFGDEILGRVVAIGDDARVTRQLEIGDRVVVESRWPCDGCRACDRGQYYLCETRGGLTVGYGTVSSAEPPHLWGGYSTHTFVPASALVYKVPVELSDAAALIACSPLANGIRWVEASGAAAADHVTVIGPGTQGLSCALAAIRVGAHVSVIGLESDEERLAMAATLGARVFGIAPGETIEQTAARIEKDGGPVDAVIEAAGVSSARQLAARLVRPMGTWVNVSVATPQSQPIDWMAMMMKEITIVNPISHPHTVGKAFDLALELLRDGIDLGAWITHVYPLERAATAIEAASYQLEVRPVKVALAPCRP